MTTLHLIVIIVLPNMIWASLHPTTTRLSRFKWAAALLPTGVSPHRMFTSDAPPGGQSAAVGHGRRGVASRGRAAAERPDVPHRRAQLRLAGGCRACRSGQQTRPEGRRRARRRRSTGRAAGTARRRQRADRQRQGRQACAPPAADMLAGLPTSTFGRQVGVLCADLSHGWFSVQILCTDAAQRHVIRIASPYRDCENLCWSLHSSSKLSGAEGLPAVLMRALSSASAAAAAAAPDVQAAHRTPAAAGGSSHDAGAAAAAEAARAAADALCALAAVLPVPQRRWLSPLLPSGVVITAAQAVNYLDLLCETRGILRVPPACPRPRPDRRWNLVQKLRSTHAHDVPRPAHRLSRSRQLHAMHARFASEESAAQVATCLDDV